MKTRIVIAKDDPLLMELLTIRLELAGYHTVCARNGLEALDRIRNADPAGVVLDLGLPGCDGFEVLSQLKDRRGYSSVPTLVLTARHGIDDVQRAIGLGAWDYVKKPFDDRQLIQRIARMLKQAPVQTVYV